MVKAVIWIKKTGFDPISDLRESKSREFRPIFGEKPGKTNPSLVRE